MRCQQTIMWCADQLELGIATNDSTLMDFKVQWQDMHGKCNGKAVLKNTYVNSNFNCNLVSTNQLFKDGFTRLGSCKVLAMVHRSDRHSMVFDMKMYTASSFLLAGHMTQTDSLKLQLHQYKNAHWFFTKNQSSLPSPLKSWQEPNQRDCKSHQYHDYTWDQEHVQNTTHDSIGWGMSTKFNMKVYSDTSFA